MLISLIRSDMVASYGRVRFIPLVSNASLQACVLVRLAQVAPKPLYVLARAALLALFSIDVGRGAKIGPGLILPHPVGIVIGSGAILGNNVTIYQNVTIGRTRSGYPQIGNRVTIYPCAVVVGAITVSDAATVGALAFVDSDVAAGAVIRGGR